MEKSYLCTCILGGCQPNIAVGIGLYLRVGSCIVQHLPMDPCLQPSPPGLSSPSHLLLCQRRQKATIAAVPTGFLLLQEGLVVLVKFLLVLFGGLQGLGLAAWLEVSISVSQLLSSRLPSLPCPPMLSASDIGG